MLERVTYVEPDGHGRSPALKHRIVAAVQGAEPAGDRVLEEDTTASRVVREEHDGGLQLDLIHISTAIADRVRFVRLLRHQRTTVGVSSRVGNI